jgi:hypothetical protein
MLTSLIAPSAAESMLEEINTTGWKSTARASPDSEVDYVITAAHRPLALLSADCQRNAKDAINDRGR